MSAKKVKVVALRLPTDTQQLIKDGAQQSETTQPDFVQAALELAQEDRDSLERVYKRAREIRRARTEATTLAAVDTKSRAFANYSEEWPVRPIGNEGEYESDWIHWTHDQLDAIAGKFATTDYWHDRFQHWKHAGEDDRARLVHEWRMTMAALPVPVRHLCWCVLVGIGGDGFTAAGAGVGTFEDIRGSAPRDDGLLAHDPAMPDKVSEHVEALKSSLEYSLFNDLPWPLDNQFDGCKLEMISRFKSAGRKETGINSISNITSPNDLDELLSGTETIEENIKILGIATAYNDDERFPSVLTRRESGYPVCTFDNLTYPERGDRMSLFRKFAKLTSKAWVDIIPKKYGDLFDEAPLSEQGGDPFTNPPRSKTLYRIGFLLLSEEHCLKYEFDPHAIGYGMTFNDLFKKLEVSKAAISKLLADWDILFERERSEAGTIKRGGRIRLSGKGREFLTSATIAEKGELPFDWLAQLLTDLKQEPIKMIIIGGGMGEVGHANEIPNPKFWDEWTDKYLANWDAEQTERDFPR